MIDAIYRRLMDRDFALEDAVVVILLVALINILGHHNRGDSPMEVLLMVAYGERGLLDRPNLRIMTWRNGALSGNDLANKPGLGSSRTYQPGEMPLPTKPRPGLRRMHQEMNSETASSSSQLKTAVPSKRARVEDQTNETMQDLNGTIEEPEKTRRELDQVTKTMLSVEEDRDMWKKLFEDCTKKQGQERERLRQEYKEQSERLALTLAVEKVIPARNVPRGQPPIELLTPRELSQTTEVRPATTTGRVTISDPSDTLGDSVRIGDTGRVELSQETIKKTGVDSVTLPVKTSRAPERKIKEMPMKKESRVFDVQKNNQVKNIFTGVPEADPRACFNRST